MRKGKLSENIISCGMFGLVFKRYLKGTRVEILWENTRDYKIRITEGSSKGTTLNLEKKYVDVY
jgi:hypothetical protein